jgi:hypothetical protein
MKILLFSVKSELMTAFIIIFVTVPSFNAGIKKKSNFQGVQQTAI